jgi:uncharacterized protein (DUF1330 family)
VPPFKHPRTCNHEDVLYSITCDARRRGARCHGSDQSDCARNDPGAYAIVAFNEISDPAGFKENVVLRAPDIVKKAGGHFLARTDKITVLRAADPPLKRYVIIAFDNVQQAQTWYSSEDMKGLNSYTDKNTKGRAFVVEALPQ